jgi:hypothetical protein
VNFPAANIKDTPFAHVKFAFVNITPELAADWLKANRKNRKLKDRTVEAYGMDMKNGAWLTTHQGIAFDDDDNLIDGQHRLMGVVQSKTAVLMLVTRGWPAGGGKRKTMDAVDRGVQRSLPDQLHLQHDIERRDAGKVVQICNAVAAACAGMVRVHKSTTDTVLAVFAIYKPEIQWFLANPITQHGLKQATVAACMVMGRSVWADKTDDALKRLQTGENLTRENPLLHLRNWLMGAGGDEYADLVRRVTFHHLAAFVDGKAVPQICLNSELALNRVLKLHQVRVEKICAIYGQTLPAALRAAAADEVKPVKVSAKSPEAIKIGWTLNEVFTSTDLVARVDDVGGQWLLVWLNAGWIVSAGVGQFRKTEKFGK